MRAASIILAIVGVTSWAAACTASELPVTTMRASPVHPSGPTAAETPPRWLANLHAQQTQELEARLTPSPTPTFDSRPLHSSGPWVVRSENDGIWVSNADQTGHKRLVELDQSPYDPYPLAVSPDGTTIGVSVAPEPDSTIPSQYQLLIFQLPRLSPVLTIPLFAQSQLDYIAEHFPAHNDDLSNFLESATYRRLQIRAGIVDEGSLRWSPDGHVLAFVAAIEGATSDVYALHVTTGEITRLSSGSSEAGHLVWSPDSSFVVHTAVNDYNVGRSGSDLLDSLWAASPDGAPPKLLIDGSSVAIGWVSDRLLLAAMDDFPCGLYDLMLVDVPTARYSIIAEGPIYQTGPLSENVTLEVPPPTREGEREPWFLEGCPSPLNPPSQINREQIEGLPASAFTPAQPSSIIITVEDGLVSFLLTDPTPTYTPSPTRTPRPTKTPFPP